MIDYDKLMESLVPLFRPVLSLSDNEYPLIIIPSNYKSPTRSYASIQLLSHVGVGQLEENDIFSAGRQVRQDQNLTIRINTYGDKAHTRAANLAVTLEYPSMTGKLGSVGLCWRSTTPVKNISSLVTSHFEQRATFDMRLGTSWGDLNQTSLNPDTEGLPSTGAFDSETVPVESVQIGLYVDDTPETQGDEKLICETLIEI